MLRQAFREFEKDAIGSHLIGIHHNETSKVWPKGEPSPKSIFGDLKAGQAEYVFKGIGGQNFPLMYSENTKEVFKSGADVIGGFCFLSRGLITASKKVVDKNGRKFEVQIDLSGILPKPLFEGGAEVSTKSKALLNGAELTKGGWKVKAPGKKNGAPLGVLLKAVRYFEIARASNRRLTLVLPTNEYAAAVAANTELLSMPQKKARQAVKAIGSDYARTLEKLGKEFFPEVQLRVILTHERGFQKTLKKFEAEHAKEFEAAQAQEGQADGFISGASKEQVRIIRNVLKEESTDYLRLFSYLFSRKTPTVFGLHARDFVGYPLEGLTLAEKIVGKQNINKNVGFVGVTGGPAVSTQTAFPPLIGLTVFGQESKELGEGDKSRPADLDIRLDDYFGLPTQNAAIRKQPDEMGGKLLTRPSGKCVFGHYARNLGPYVGVVPEEKTINALRNCWHDKSHTGCEQMFLETYNRLAKKLKFTPVFIASSKIRRRLQKAKYAAL